VYNTYFTILCVFLYFVVWPGGVMVRVLACDKMSRVRVPAIPLSGNNLGQVVYTHVPLSPSSIIWGGQGAVMLCGCERNRSRSGVALAMHHRLQWFIHLRAHGLDREMSTPPTLSGGVWPIYRTCVMCMYRPMYVCVCFSKPIACICLDFIFCC